MTGCCVDDWENVNCSRYAVVSTCWKWFKESDRIDHLWDVRENQVQSMEAPPHNLRDVKGLLLTFWCRMPQDTFRGQIMTFRGLDAGGHRTLLEVLWSPCLYWSELFWWYEGDLRNIRQVVLMLWLIGVVILDPTLTSSISWNNIYC